MKRIVWDLDRAPIAKARRAAVFRSLVIDSARYENARRTGQTYARRICGHYTRGSLICAICYPVQMGTEERIA